MYLSRIKFWLNLALVVATTYIIIWYIFNKPSSNQCQMTFMMEPPKFIPLLIDKKSDDISYPQYNIFGTSNQRNERDDKYRLYMYSEFGFPLVANMKRDLKDSMPVLFVPGNAGSYQQVRSLASTCIRRQLQSLDAFKFIFYTIDFKGQLSGISGQLIEEQTEFVQKSLEYIAKAHSTETNGVILIGHSVGGFISKVLFSRPNFDPSSVPLLISLASPLTRPYLTFDDKMRELYKKTNLFWKHNQSSFDNTISVSISGGKPDRLVPMHLSLDPQYDISLTTSSIKDVWLPTDHVCITWCRELMQKLAHLLSALMDKRQTKLISNKKAAMSIIKRELLTSDADKIRLEKNNSKVIYRDWKSMRPHLIYDFEEFYSATRSQLIDSIIVLNVTSKGIRNIHIWIDHIDSLKTNGMFGCRSLTSSETNGQINCIEKLDLMILANSMPSQRFEPKKTTLNFETSDIHYERINYIVFDFVNHNQGFPDRSKLPESLVVQRQQMLDEKRLYVPSLLEYVTKKFLFINSYQFKITSQGDKPLTYLRFRLTNLRENNQIFSILYESQNCRSKERPNGATILFLQAGYLSESFHSGPNSYDNDTLSLIAKISNRQTIIFSKDHRTRKINEEQSYLEFYIDGTCENRFKIELDLLDLIVNTVQENLGKILTFMSLLAHSSMVAAACNLRSNKQEIGSKGTNFMSNFGRFLAPFFGYAIYLSENFQVIELDRMFEEVISFLLIYTISLGGIAFLDSMVKRIIDLSIVLNNIRHLLRRKSEGDGLENHTNTNQKNVANGNSKVTSNNLKLQRISMTNNFDWLLMGLAIMSSVVFSTVVISIFQLIILVKSGLGIDIRVSQQQREHGTKCCSHKKSDGCVEQDDNGSANFRNNSNQFELVLSVAVMCSLTLLSNIPSALLKINSNKLGSLDNIFDPMHRDANFLASTMALVLIKLIFEEIEKLEYNHGSGQTTTNDVGSRNMYQKRQKLSEYSEYTATWRLKKAADYAHLLALAPIVLIEQNICQMNSAFLISVLWLKIYLQLNRRNPMRV